MKLGDLVLTLVAYYEEQGLKAHWSSLDPLERGTVDFV